MKPPAKGKPGQGKSGPLAAFDRFHREFFTGLTEFSPLALLVALGVLVASIGLAGWYFSPATLAGPDGRFLARSAKDAEAHATWGALRMARVDPARPRLIVLGSSISATAFANEAALAEDLKRLTGRDWAVAMLCTPLQSPLDQLALIENALGAAPGPAAETVIALGFSTMRDELPLAKIAEREAMGRIGLRSDWADAQLAAWGETPRARTGWYVIDNSHFLAVNGRAALSRFITRRAAPRDFARNAPDSPVPLAKRPRARVGERLRDSFARPQPYAEQALETLGRRLAAYPSVRLVYLDEAVNPEFLASAGLADEDEAIRGRFRAWAARRDVPYWEIAREVAPPPAVYFDDLHINSRPVQQAFRAALARRVAELDGAPHGR